MKNKYIDKEKKLAELEKHIDKTKWECMCPHCTKQAINSHLLQRHGVLSYVAEKGHLCEMRFEDFFKWPENEPMCVKKVGIQQAISYPLFCNKHDTELFAQIEGEYIDFNNYISQLLFSYRSICSEIRKKEFVQARYGAWDECKMKDIHAKGTDKGLKDLLYSKFLFERELEKPNQKFTFLHLSYPFIAIYASGAVSYEPVDYGDDRSIKEVWKKKVWDGFFINIIPQHESLEIIIGYHNNHVNAELRRYVESWKDLSLEQLQVKLTDLFTARLEMWGMAPSLYESICEEKKMWFIKTLKNIHLDFHYDIRKELKENLFEK
jgi:hypothetical protein